jgi:magnesium transporter
MATTMALPGRTGEVTFHFFSELFHRRIRTTEGHKVGRVSDLVFVMREPYPEAIGILVEHGIGQESELIPWSAVRAIREHLVEVEPPQGGHFPLFVDEPGWVLIDKHLMGRTILDIDGRRIEAVNDVQLLESHGRMVIAHVDTSFNGFLRRWHLSGLHLLKERLISWKYVQPLNVEDAVATDAVSLSLTRDELPELPPEDLADALEELSGEEQEALFSALDAETAAETLIEAEPRAQRQLIAALRKEEAGEILSELSVPQLAALFSVLPHDQTVDLLQTLPPDEANRVRAILGEREVTAGALVSSDYVSMPGTTPVGEALGALRGSGREPHEVSYVYIVNQKTGVVEGVVDLRELVLAPDDVALEEIMAAPVVAVEDEDLRDDVHRLFAKYHFRMLPVVDRVDRMLGVIRYGDVMRGLEGRMR